MKLLSLIKAHRNIAIISLTVSLIVGSTAVYAVYSKPLESTVKQSVSESEPVKEDEVKTEIKETASVEDRNVAVAPQSTPTVTQEEPAEEPQTTPVRTALEIARQDYPHLIPDDMNLKCFNHAVSGLSQYFTEAKREEAMKHYGKFGNACAGCQYGQRAEASLLGQNLKMNMSN